MSQNNKDLLEAWTDVMPADGALPVQMHPYTSQDQIEKAVACYRKRQNRKEHPDGEFDRSGRWYPSEKEKCQCCHNVRSPTARWPYSLMRHCRSIEHIAHLFGVDVHDLRKAIHPRMEPSTTKDCWQWVTE